MMGGSGVRVKLVMPLRRSGQNVDNRPQGQQHARQGGPAGGAGRTGAAAPGEAGGPNAAQGLPRPRVMRALATRSFMRLMQRSRVLLPQPDGPMSAVTRWYSTWRSTPESTAFSP